MEWYSFMVKRFSSVYGRIGLLLGNWRQTLKILTGITIANMCIFFGFHWFLGGLVIYPVAFKNQLSWLSFLYTFFLILIYMLVNTAMSSWAISVWSGKASFQKALRGVVDVCVRILIIATPFFFLLLIAWLTSAFGSGQNAGIFTFPPWFNNAKSSPEFRIDMIASFALPVLILVSIRICTLLPRITMGESGFTALSKAWSDANGRFFLFMSSFIPLALLGWFVSGNLMNVMYINVVVFSVLVMLAAAINMSLYVESTEA